MKQFLAPSLVWGAIMLAPALADEAILKIPQGGTGGKTAAEARAFLGAAASGANSDITSLSAVTDITVSGLPSCTLGSSVAPVPAGHAFQCSGLILIAQ